MLTLNLFNGFCFILNIILLYLIFKKILINKISALFLSVLYFFIPIVFQVSLYTNPNTFSLLFFLLSNLYFILYITKGKIINLILTFIFQIISFAMRLDTLLFYFSFIFFVLIFNKSFRKGFCIYLLSIIFSIFTLNFLQKLLNLNNRKDIFSIVNNIFNINFNNIILNIGQIVISIGISLVIITASLVIYFLIKKKYKIVLAFLILNIPFFLYIILCLPSMHIVRYLLPLHIGPLIFIGKWIDFLKNKRFQTIFLFIIYFFHFLTMPLSYFLVKKFYPLKRKYLSSERIIVEYVPLGNIFLNTYYLRLEKRKSWNIAEYIVKNYDKVIILSNHNEMLPYHFFFYYLFEDVVSYKETFVKRLYTKQGNKDFIFIYILDYFDEKLIWDYLSNPAYKDYFIHFPLNITPRTTKLYQEIENFCKQNNRRLI